MNALNIPKLDHGINIKGSNIFFIHRGEFEGRYVFLSVDSFGNTEVYESPSIVRDSGRDGFPSQSFFPKGHEEDLAELISTNNAERVAPVAWGKWEYFFGISQVSNTIMTNNQERGIRQVYQPIRSDHFKLFLDLFEEHFEGEIVTGKQRTRTALSFKRRRRNIYAEFIRLYLLANGLAIYAVPDKAVVMWFSDSYKGVHGLSSESLVTERELQSGKIRRAKKQFLNTWVEAEPVKPHWTTEYLFKEKLLSENSFRVWFESSPIHSMRLGLGYFGKFKVAAESFRYLTHLTSATFTATDGESYSIALAPWPGRTILVE